jgi:ketosteroid isomerase-like protein
MPIALTDKHACRECGPNEGERTMFLRQCLSGAAALCLAASAFATPTEDAQRHLGAIAGNDIDALMSTYADGATMQWIGGPLDGTYAGREQLMDLWTRFAKAQGKLDLAVFKIEEYGNPKGATVSANARYRGNAQTKVRHVIVYRDGKIVSEVWQIDPSMQFQQ